MLKVSQRITLAVALIGAGGIGVRQAIINPQPTWMTDGLLKLIWFASSTALVLGVGLVLWVIIEFALRKWLTPQSMRFVFPNEAANSDSKITLFRESYQLLPDGKPIKHKLSLQRFFIGIENCTDKTLRNVRFVIESITIPPRPTELHCQAKRTGGTSIDIQPKSMEYFFLGEGYDSSHGAGAMIRQPAEVDMIAADCAITSFYLGTLTGGSFPLFKNDGYVISFSAYADDATPISAEAILNTKGKLELRLKESSAVFSPT